MKVRLGFVSNSSSASFVLNLNEITAKQYLMIKNHACYWIEVVGPKDEDGEDFYNQCLVEGNKWEIDIKGDLLVGETGMNNLDMETFMKLIGVDLSKVRFTYD